MSKDSAFDTLHPLLHVQMAAPDGYTTQVAELIANVTAKPVGVFADWPQNVVDAVGMAFERLNDKARYTGGTYTLLCAEADEEEGKPFIKITGYRYVPKPIRQ